MPVKIDKDTTRLVLRYYVRHVRDYPKQSLGIAFAIPLTVLVNGFLPTLIVASVLSRLSQGHFQAHHLWASFGPELLAYAALLLIGHFTWRIVDRFVWILEGNVQRDLAEEVFDKLLNQTADFHANNFTGSLVSQNSKLLSSYVRLADTTIFQVYPMLMSIVYAVIIMLVRAPLFAVLLTLFTLVYLYFAFRISKPVRRAGAKFAAAESKQTGYLADAITNSMAIKSFASSDYERRRFHSATSQTRTLLGRFSAIHKQQMNVLGLSSRFISGVSLLVAVVSVMTFHANIGTVFLILSYTSTIVDQLFSFGNNSLRSYNRAFGDSREMIKTLNEIPAILDPKKPEVVRIHRGTIQFDQVVFRHDGSTEPIFDGLTIRIKQGEKVGLVGHSGSGKTTFTRILQRFSDIQGGRILIDGQDIAAITQEDLHRHIAYVPQEPLLFHRTIAENISYGNDETTHEEIIEVAKMASAHEFIETLPSGYDTLVGERGVKLSGGQRQRIAIARAMIKNAPILVLDEATSALDSESEAVIQDALWKLMEGRTSIAIAHRLSTIQQMDRIIVLHDGKVVEEGSHKELIHRGGAYAQLWMRQSGGFMGDS